MPKKETKRRVIILLLVDIIFIGIFIFLFLFTKNLIAESVDKENSIKTELKKENVRILMKEDLFLAKMYQEKLSGYMISSGGIVDFIKTVEQLVLKSGLKSEIKTVIREVYDKDDSSGVELVRVNMDVLGSWKNIQFFLTSLENYPLKIDIKKAVFNKFSDYIINSQKTPQWAGSFEFTVLKIKDK